MSRNDRQFDMSLDVNAPLDAVWNVLSDPRELMRWFPVMAEVTPGVGGSVTWSWGDVHTWKSRILEWKPGELLRLSYDSAVPDGRGGKKPLIVEFRLAGRGGATTLRIVHSGFGPEAGFDAEYDGISAGWPVELRSLRHYLENHRGKDRVLAWEKRSTLEAAGAVWSRLADEMALGDVTSLHEGAPFRVAIPGTEGVRGTILFSPTRHEFSGIAENLGRGWFRVHCEYWSGATQVWLWLALYECVEAAPRYQAAFRDLIDRAIASADAGGDGR